MLSGSVPLLVQPISAFPQAASLQPGQRYGAVVREHQQGLALAAGRLLIPLPEGAGLSAGQRVLIEVLPGPGGPQLSISPEAGATAKAPAGPPSPIQALLPLLEALGRLDLAPRIHATLPRHLPGSGGHLGTLVQLLLSSEGLATDLETLARLLNTARDSGGLPSTLTGPVSKWLALVPGGAADEWHALILRTREVQGAIARIAASLKGGATAAPPDALKESTASLVSRLLADPAFAQWLDERGELDTFKSLAQRIQERAGGAELQNLRNLDQSYQFLDLPVPERLGFQRAQIHAFGGDAAGGRHPKNAIHRTVLDLELSHLGAVWVAVQSAGAACTCHFDVEDPEVATLIEAEAPALSEALRAAGYARAEVTAGLWDGDRARALLTLLAPYQKLDLEI